MRKKNHVWTSSNSIVTFKNPEFGQIRTMVMPDGQVGFIGKDVAEVLGYSNTRDALRKHVEDEDKTTVAIRDTGSNYKSQAVIINESGLYSLILSSKLPKAREFKHWVTSEVLPQIRKTGGYIPVTKEDNEESLTNKTMKILMQTLKTQQKLMTEKDDVIAQLTPMAEYAEEVLLSPTCYTMTQVAKSLSMTVQELQHFLHNRRIIYRSPSGPWMLYADYLKCGLEAYRTSKKDNAKGEVIWTSTYLVWTERGRQFINDLYQIKAA